MSQRTSNSFGAHHVDAESAARLDALREETRLFFERRGQAETSGAAPPKGEPRGKSSSYGAKWSDGDEPGQRDPCGRCGTRRDVHDLFGCKRWRPAQ